MFRLAHLTDPHLPLPGPPTLPELMSKRAIGYANWLRSRRYIHRSDILESVVQDVLGHDVDHIAVTGDLVNVAARSEFTPARLFLERLGHPALVSLVPGNHDAYSGAWARQIWRDWAPYMRGDDEAARDDRPDGGFPYIRRRGKIMLIGLSSAITTGPFRAYGRLGERQLSRLKDILQQTADPDIFRIILIHHSPLPGDPSRSLHDATELCDVLRRHGANLVLHGHDHVATLNGIHGDAGVTPVICAPSASAEAHGRKPIAGWSLLLIDQNADGWQCRLQRRSVTQPGAPLAVSEEVALSQPA